MNPLTWRYELDRIFSVRCEPAWSLAPGWSDRLRDCDLWTVWAGRGRMRLRSGEIELRPGVCVWMRPGGRYAADQDPNDRLGVIAIHFTPRDDRGRACLTDRRLPGEVHLVRDWPFFRSVAFELVRRNRLMAGRPPDAARTAHLHNLFRVLIGTLLIQETVAAPPAWARHRQFIEEQAARLYEQPATIAPVREMARSAGLAPDYYTRVFRSLMGSTPREWIQRARLERACTLLRETTSTVTEIADQTGYADVFQFSRIFKNRMGQSPRAWRNARQNQ